MTEQEKTSQSGDSSNLSKRNLNEEDPQSTGLISSESLIRRLERGSEARARFVESHLNKSLAFQIRSLRGDKWTQAAFAEKLGMKHPNNVSARLENSHYGKHTLTTLKKIAAACDVGLVVWFIPFSRLVDWASGTPYVDKGLSPDFYNIPTFAEDFGCATSATSRTKEIRLGPMPVEPPDESAMQPLQTSTAGAHGTTIASRFAPMGELGSALQAEAVG